MNISVIKKKNKLSVLLKHTDNKYKYVPVLIQSFLIGVFFSAKPNSIMSYFFE